MNDITYLFTNLNDYTNAVANNPNAETVNLNVNDPEGFGYYTEKPMSINEVCFESGFNNFSHFNKSFKAYSGKSASQYRNELKTIIK
jgi:AraC-like DNA-binding protein